MTFIVPLTSSITKPVPHLRMYNHVEVFVESEIFIVVVLVLVRVHVAVVVVAAER